jgi:predicted nucleotidyltransferase
MPTGEPPNNVAFQAPVAAMLARRLPALRFAYLFGSAARGELGPDSDYDVAIDSGQTVEPAKILELSGHLEGVVGRKVDVVDLAVAGAVLKMQVLSSGQLLTCRDKRALAEFKMYTPSQYEDWKHLSEPLERALVRRFQA